MRAKKTICIILTAVMLFTCLCFTSSAKYSGNRDFTTIYPELYASECDNSYPTIIVPGINHSLYYLSDENGNVVKDKKGNEMSSTLLLLNSDDLVTELLKLVPSLIASLTLQKDLGLSKGVTELVKSIMKYMGCDENGETVYDLRTVTYDYPVSKMNDDEKSFFYRMLPVEPIADIYGEENLYLYTFPLFGDPMKSAESLDAYIENVLKSTKAEKVNLVSVSLGGTVLTAYLDSGKNIDKVAKIVNMVSLLGGTDIIADFMARNFNLEDKFLYDEYFPILLEGLAGDESIGYLINVIIRLMPRELFEKFLSGAYTALHETVLLNNPQFWAMIPNDRYAEIAAKYLSSPEKAVLKQKTDRFHLAQSRLFENMKAADKNGTKVFTVCGYGLTYSDGVYGYFGISKSTESANSDGIIPVYSTSMGATWVKKGETLSDEYIASHDKKYISPDKQIDASTCLFPDRTWYFGQQHHEIAYNDVAIRLVAQILGGRIDNILSSRAFPQFNFSRDTRRLVRCDRGYFWKAEEALQCGTLSTENQTSLKKAYDECVYMLQNTICDNDIAQEKIEALKAEMISCGIIEKDKKENNFVLNALRSLSNILYKIYGRKGFFEILK